MALRSASLGSLLQGVSQQPDRVMLDGQVKEQINLISDVTKGLTTRPATKEKAVLTGATPEHKFQDIIFKGQEYIIGYKDNDIQAWLFDGTVVPIEYSLEASPNYIGDEMRFHVVDDKIVIVNRNRIVKTSTDTDGFPWHAALFHSLGGQFLRTYKVDLEFSDGTVITASYTTPDGSVSGDAAATSSESIITNLVTILQNDSTLPTGTTISQKFDVALVFHPSMSINITVSDGEAGEILRGVSSTVKKVEDLPRFAPNGKIVKVETSKAEEDDFWLKFDAQDVTSNDGSAGFGSEGTWKEWYDPTEERLFDLVTMPHTLEGDSAGLTVDVGPFIGRQVGNSDSSPFPSFIGKKIRDITGFEGRLAFLSPASVVMSRTNKPFDLWRESATVSAVSDPIDIESTTKNDLRMDWFVPFDRDLFIIADPGDSQFVIKGGGVTPSNIGMVLTTEYEVVSGGTPPVSTGRTIFLPFTNGKFSGINEFFTSSDNNANAANDITATKSSYINGLITGMAVSQTFNLGLFRTSKNPDTVWVYKYLRNQEELVQSAWSKWQFSEKIKYFFFRSSLVYFLGQDNENNIFVHVLDLNKPEGIHGYHEMLDRRIDKTVQNGSIDLPYPAARFLQGNGTANPGIEVRPLTETRLDPFTYRYIFDPEIAPDGAELIGGKSVVWSIEPARVFGKDRQGNVDTSQKITVQDYVVHVDRTGEFKAVGKSPFADDWEYNTFVFPFDDDPLDPDRLLLQTGPITIPWGERADWSRLVLTSDDIRPFTMLELEWIGQIIRKQGTR